MDYCEQVIEWYSGKPLYCNKKAVKAVGYKDLKFRLCKKHAVKFIFEMNSNLSVELI